MNPDNVIVESGPEGADMTQSMGLVLASRPEPEAGPTVSTAESCLKQLNEAIENDLEKRRLFASLNNVELKTAERWLRGDQFPNGLNEIRLRFALEHMGYRLVELDVLSRPIYTFGKHIAYGLCTLEEAEELLSVNRQAVYRIISGRGNTTNEKLEYVVLYNEEHQQQLANYELTLPTVGPIIQKVAPAVSSEALPTNKEFIADVFVSLVKAMSPLAKLLASDDVTPEDREAIRERAGRYAIFNLKNDLVRLCGERARTTVENPK